MGDAVGPVAAGSARAMSVTPTSTAPRQQIRKAIRKGVDITWWDLGDVGLAGNIRSILYHNTTEILHRENRQAPLCLERLPHDIGANLVHQIGIVYAVAALSNRRESPLDEVGFRFVSVDATQVIHQTTHGIDIRRSKIVHAIAPRPTDCMRLSAILCNGATSSTIPASITLRDIP